MQRFKGIRVVVFDFDGTLVQSNEVKRESYFQLFDDSEENRGTIETVLAESNTMSRYEIIEALLLQMNFTGDISQQKQILTEKYGDLVLSSVKVCPEVSGARQLLETLKGRIPLYLSSLTPEDVLMEIVQYREMDHYFEGIYGYPRKKEETLELLIKKRNIDSKELLVVGDGESDRLAAEKMNCPYFILTGTTGLHDLLIS